MLSLNIPSVWIDCFIRDGCILMGCFLNYRCLVVVSDYKTTFSKFYGQSSMILKSFVHYDTHKNCLQHDDDVKCKLLELIAWRVSDISVDNHPTGWKIKVAWRYSVDPYLYRVSCQSTTDSNITRSNRRDSKSLSLYIHWLVSESIDFHGSIMSDSVLFITIFMKATVF